MTRAIGVLAVAAVACSHPPVHHPGEEFVSKIRFVGNKAINNGDLADGLALTRAEKEGDAPDPYIVDADVKRIQGDYIRLGYVDVDVRAKVDHAGDASTVTFTIEEGPRATTLVEVRGIDDAALADKVRKTLPIADGKPFDYDVYDKAKEKLLAVVQDAGYARAQLDARVLGDRTNHHAVVVLAYALGPVCKFGEISFHGVDGDLANAAEARVTFATGERYSVSKLTETQRNLYGMQRFSTVRVLPDKHGEGDIVDVRISLSEGSRHEARLGGGFGMDPLTYEARLRAGYAIAGWPGPLYSLDLDFRPAYAVLRDTLGTYEPRIRALATLSRMDLFVPYVTGSVSTGYNYLVVEAYTSYGPMARLGVETPLGTPKVRGRVGWRFEYDSFRALNPLIDADTAQALGLDKSEQLGAYEQAIVVDLRDDPIETHDGFYAEAKVAEGTPAAGGRLSFLEITPEVRGYLTLFDTTLAVRARIGGIFGDVPPTERFYAGGASSQRGFSERRLAPTLSGDVMGTFETVPIGGAGMFDSSVELRHPLGHIRGMGIGGVVFLDAADVTPTADALPQLDLHYAAGGGLRLLTIVGAVRADFGYRLNRTGPGDPEPGSTYAFHLSLGEAF